MFKLTVLSIGVLACVLASPRPGYHGFHSYPHIAAYSSSVIHPPAAVYPYVHHAIPFVHPHFAISYINHFQSGHHYH